MCRGEAGGIVEPLTRQTWLAAQRLHQHTPRPLGTAGLAQQEPHRVGIPRIILRPLRITNRYLLRSHVALPPPSRFDVNSPAPSPRRPRSGPSPSMPRLASRACRCAVWNHPVLARPRPAVGRLLRLSTEKGLERAGEMRDSRVVSEAGHRRREMAGVLPSPLLRWRIRDLYRVKAFLRHPARSGRFPLRQSAPGKPVSAAI